MSKNGDVFFPIEFSGQLPNCFCYPHNYTPHPVAIVSAEHLMSRLVKLGKGAENFGEETFANGRKSGKMFGILVVEDTARNLGYLAGFSGKLKGKTKIQGFVPPVYDRYQDKGFFSLEEQKINELTTKIDALENDPKFITLQSELRQVKDSHKNNLEEMKDLIRKSRKQRDIKRKELESLQSMQREKELKLLADQSASEQYLLKDKKRIFRKKEEEITQLLKLHLTQIENLKIKRSQLSSSLQNKLFSQYKFYNAQHETIDLLSLFKKLNRSIPSSGAGECVAPKLLNYALTHGMKPIAMAEFWWGASPASEVRLHKQYYPACRGKCEPILKHQLKGLAIDPDPLHEKLNISKKIKIIYQDEEIVVLHKPHDLLSVPGKGIFDSVQMQLKKLFPYATGPMIVHRLDMSTSGLMVAALNEMAYKHLQRQFKNQTIQKRYVALIQGIPKLEKGTVSIPLRVDLDNRPNQIVCNDYGKNAVTEYQVIQYYNDQTCRIYFYPKTGRTHQLRVHSAHYQGIGCPIVGDELYGHPSDRLYLHAEQLAFSHPKKNQRFSFTYKSDF